MIFHKRSMLYVSLTLLFIVDTARTDSAPKPNNEICTTAGCIEAAYNFLHSIDSAADPCENFYQYACGKWIADNPIPDDKSSVGTYASTIERLANAMRSLLQDDKIKLKINSKAVNLTRMLYQQCANNTRLSQLGSAPLLSMLKSLGGWPLLNADWTAPTNFSLAKLLASFYDNAFPFNPLWTFGVAVDVKNVTRHILTLAEPAATLSLPREHYLNATRYQRYLDAYEKYIHDVVKLIAKDGNISMQSPHVDADVKNILKFETAIAGFTTPKEDLRNRSLFYNLRSFSRLKQDLPNFDWQTFVASILPKDVQPILTDHLELNVASPSFMGNVFALLQKTETKTLINYAVWKLVKFVVNFLDERYRDIGQDFTSVLSGQETKTPRWKMCVAETTRLMPIAAGALYVDGHVSNEDKAEAEKMVTNLIFALGDILRESEWMDNSTKTAALTKLKFITPHVGYEDIAKNATALDEYYKDLDYTTIAHGFFQAVQAIEKSSNTRSFRDLRKVVDRNRYEGTAAIVNAQYSPAHNYILIFAGKLQPPFFSGSYPKFVNYGSAGVTIGHELTHAFDDAGSQYDEIGRLRNWWSHTSLTNFRNKTACIVNQYNAYEVPEIKLHMNGKMTQGENIADNGGVKEAYKAYRTYVEKLGHEEARLPGLDLSNDQVFFLSFAMIWCNEARPEHARTAILMDPHSPGMFRVIGALSNTPAFATVFKCKPGSKMNPLRKCSVW